RRPYAEPMPFKPVRTCVGMRNTVRLLRRYAKPIHRLAFGLELARLLPLEATAAVLGAESWSRLGEWSWRDVADAYLRDPAGGEARGRRPLVALPLAGAGGGSPPRAPPP